MIDPHYDHIDQAGVDQGSMSKPVRETTLD